MAIRRITATLGRFGDELCAATDVQRRIRRHPFLAAGIGACLGFLGGPLVLRTIRHALAAASRRPNDVRGLVLASVRAVRRRGS